MVFGGIWIPKKRVGIWVLKPGFILNQNFFSPFLQRHLFIFEVVSVAHSFPQVSHDAVRVPRDEVPPRCAS